MRLLGQEVIFVELITDRKTWMLVDRFIDKLFNNHLQMTTLPKAKGIGKSG
jgi:hypothetical protein